MHIPLTEPTAPRYIFVTSSTNTVHVMMPVTSGTEIGLDNTCKSAVVLKEFFDKSNKGRSVLDELQAYQEALELDIVLIGKDCELRQLKYSRLRQINTYITIVKEVLKSDMLKSLYFEYAIYPQPLQNIIAEKRSNLYSMHLRPYTMDTYLRSEHPLFSLGRSAPSMLSFQMSETFQDVSPSVSKKERIIAFVLETQAAKSVDFEGIRSELTRTVFDELGITVDLMHTNSGIELTQKMIKDAMNPENAREYVEAFLGYCAPDLFDTVQESPFDTTQTCDQLSIVTQFFLAIMNICCRSLRISLANFGKILDASRALSKELAEVVKASRMDGLNIEQALLDFVNDNQKKFQFERPLQPADRAKIKEKFSQYFAQIKDSDHFDEFIVLDNSKPGPFVSHQGTICLNFIEFVKRGWPELESEFCQSVVDDFNSNQNPIRHDNPWVYAQIELSLEEFTGFINTEGQLNRLLKKLPPVQQREMLALPMIQEKLQVVKFLDFVAKGKQGEAEQILLQFPDANIVLQTGAFTDYSGRTFTCTAFEYAYWAKDIHMCSMLQKYMDASAKKEIVRRCKIIDVYGLAYVQDGQSKCSKHFDFTPLISALENCSQAYEDVQAGVRNDSVFRAWVEIGRAQRDLPAHVVHEYCREDRSFSPTPLFLEEVLPRTVRLFNLNSTVVDEDWFPLSENEDLGETKGYYRGFYANPTPGGDEDPALDLAAMRSLNEVRTKQFARLVKVLQPKPETNHVRFNGL